MTKLFIAMICDRHTDPEPFPFTTADAAIAFARSTAIANALGGEGDLEEPDMPAWLYYASYSEEGDAVWVLEKELDAPPPGAETEAR